MKKIIAVLIAVLMFALVGCDKKEEKVDIFEFTDIKQEYYSYLDICNDYLIKDYTTKSLINDYVATYVSSNQDIVIKWNCNDELVTGYRFQYSCDFDILIREILLDKDAREVHLNNLYKGVIYNCKLIAEKQDGNKEITKNIYISERGPRVMTVDGVANIRDLGGYTTSSGKKIKQGLIYRGGEFNGESTITEDGLSTINSVLKIKSDLDLRSPSEAQNITSSPLGKDVTYKNISLASYYYAFQTSGKGGYKDVFKFLANEDNYPIYFHCRAGADRTGSVAYLLLALLGAEEEDMIHDFEFTTFSKYGLRRKEALDFKTMVEKLDTQVGNNRQEKMESYLLSIGLSQEEIDSIKNILLEDENE